MQEDTDSPPVEGLSGTMNLSNRHQLQLSTGQAPDYPRWWRSTLVLGFAFFSLVSSTCYHDNGNIALDDIPCNSSAIGTTHCCQNYATCLTTGLCMLSIDTSFNTGSCTDQSWSAGTSCFRKCPGSLGALNTLYRCDSNEWCCSEGGNTTSCCQDPGVQLFSPTSAPDTSLVMGGEAWAPGYTLAPVSAVQSSEPPANSSVAIQESTPVTSSARQTTTSCPGSGNGTMKAGLGAGLGTGLPLCAALAAACILLYRERRINRNTQHRGRPFMLAYPDKDSPPEQSSIPELPSNQPLKELAGGDMRIQLPADYR